MSKFIKRRFTFMLVPHSGDQMRTLTIPALLFVVIGALFVVITIILTLFSYKFIQYRNSNQELQTYKVESETIKTEFNAITNTAETVQKKLDTLQKLEQDLRTKGGLPPTSSNNESQGGKGGLPSRSGFDRESLSLTRTALQVLNQDIDQRVASIDQTLDTLAKKETERKAAEEQEEKRLAHIPNIWPTNARTITSGFGYRSDPFTGGYTIHTGFDIAGAYGSDVIATADGVVISADWNGGYGKSILISHGNGLSTRFGHLSAIKVSAGDSIKRGELIGLMGNTGRSTGTHLHYEVLVNGEPVSPSKYLP